MPRAIGLLLAACWLLIGQAALAGDAPAALTGTVTWVYDADTLEIASHGKVRLLGIDAPEKAGSDRDEKFIKLGIARKHLRPVHGAGLAWCLRNVKGQQVTLTFDTTQKERRDRHGRLLAYIYLPDGRLLNRLLLEQGLVIVYRRFPIDLKQDFLSAETEAKHRGLGLWAR
ncbi:MAG: hypothetical protein FIB02_04630 [Desulfuromonas sp.]|nr:hypothetical protein [Desulfuromonas sp.]